MQIVLEELEQELAAAKVPRGNSRKRPAADSSDPVNDRIRRVSEFIIEGYAIDFEHWLKSKPDLDADARFHLGHALEACAQRLIDLVESLPLATKVAEGEEDVDGETAEVPTVSVEEVQDAPISAKAQIVWKPVDNDFVGHVAGPTMYGILCKDPGRYEVHGTLCETKPHRATKLFVKTAATLDEAKKIAEAHHAEGGNT